MTFLEREDQRDPQRRWMLGPWIEQTERVVVDPEAFPMSWGNGRIPAGIDLGDLSIFRSGFDIEGTRDRGPGYLAGPVPGSTNPRGPNEELGRTVVLGHSLGKRRLVVRRNP